MWCLRWWPRAFFFLWCEGARLGGALGALDEGVGALGAGCAVGAAAGAGAAGATRCTAAIRPLSLGTPKPVT